MPASALYLPQYAESHALVVGINKYQHINPLIHARSDAEAVAEILVDKFSFPKTNIQLLLDTDATRDAILRSYLKFASVGSINPDDRILIFFAGHGLTATGRRGDIGFLVPVDGTPDDLATLIRWDQLTLNADLISAKHMLFLMDACYGGLALKRTAIPPGSMRFLKDMLQRYARQVLTAGKADEPVSDSGGTRANHSIFTSYLLDGMEGAAAPAGGIITGHSLMAYVYDKVGSDAQSRQTPHFGFLEGDGDFIFDPLVLRAITPKPSAGQEPVPDLDIYIKAPTVAPPPAPHEETIAEILKRLIPNSGEKIRLNDFITRLIRAAQENLSTENFPPHGPHTKEEIATRLQNYEDAIGDLIVATVLLARWGSSDQLSLIENIFARIAEVEKPQGGDRLWLRLNWYPIILLMYATGISALAGRNYAALRAALVTPIYTERPYLGQHTPPVIIPAITEITEIIESFKMLPDMERKYVPRSEHIFKKLQPALEDQLFLGRDYELLFDKFEILVALTYADLRNEDATRHVWGPPGRFAWKERGDDPVYSRFVNEAKAKGDQWELLKEGFFKGSPKRFSEVAGAYGALLRQMNWW